MGSRIHRGDIAFVRVDSRDATLQAPGLQHRSDPLLVLVKLDDFGGSSVGPLSLPLVGSCVSIHRRLSKGL